MDQHDMKIDDLRKVDDLPQITVRKATPEENEIYREIMRELYVQQKGDE